MKEEIKVKNQIKAMDKSPKKLGVFSRFLQWISKGTAKASQNGGFCNT